MRLLRAHRDVFAAAGGLYAVSLAFYWLAKEPTVGEMAIISVLLGAIFAAGAFTVVAIREIETYLYRRRYGV